MQIKFVDVRGIRTRVVHEGAGHPLLLVHGFGGLAEHWWHNVDSLARDYHVFAPDLLGHGFTDPVEFAEEAPHPRFVEHLAGLVDCLGLEQFSLCGSSFGALLACLLYLRMPERVARLIICGSGSTFNSEQQLATALPEALSNAMTALANPSLENCRKRIGNNCYDRSVVPDAAALAQLISYGLPGMKESYISAMRGMMDQERSRPYRVLHRLAEIKLPTLVIWGRQDPRGNLQSAQERIPEMPNARLIVFDECGHKPFMEKPAPFHAEVRAFLSPGPMPAPHDETVGTR